MREESARGDVIARDVGRRETGERTVVTRFVDLTRFLVGVTRSSLEFSLLSSTTTDATSPSLSPCFFASYQFRSGDATDPKGGAAHPPTLSSHSFNVRNRTSNRRYAHCKVTFP